MEGQDEGLAKATAYERWYREPRGRRLGGAELRLVLRALSGCGSVLDVGCGTGFFTRKIEAPFKVGLDISSGMLRYAAGKGGVYVRGDAARLPFKTDCFDCVFCVAVLEFVEDMGAVLREMVRVARRRVAVGLLGRWGVLNIVRRARDFFVGGWFRKARFLRPADVEQELGRSLVWRSSFEALGIRGFLGEFVMGVLEIEG